MSHFYGSMKGSRGEVTRCGDTKSGISAHLRGWNVGVRVVCFHEDGVDMIQVYRTCGSNDLRPSASPDQFLTEFRE